MILPMDSTAPLYREVQPYHEWPLFILLVVRTLFGWLPIAWVAAVQTRTDNIHGDGDAILRARQAVHLRPVVGEAGTA